MAIEVYPVLAAELAEAWASLRPGLQQLDCMADAVYLDDFNPAKDPEMWSQPTVDAVEARFAPEASVS